MTGGIGQVALAGLFLLASHFGVSSTGLRPWLVARLGQGLYLGLYSLVAAVGFWWLVAAYRAAPVLVVWDYAPWQSWVPVLVNPFAFLLIVASLSQRNPTSVGQAGALDRAESAFGILRVTRNPFLWGVTLWALAHMVPNGEAAALLLFGTLALLAGLGSVLLDARLARSGGEGWARFADVTSNLPFAAIVAGRQRLVAREIGLLRLGAALLLYGGILHAHASLFGVSALPS